MTAAAHGRSRAAADAPFVPQAPSTLQAGIGGV
jgi:hypothetical protein